MPPAMEESSACAPLRVENDSATAEVVVASLPPARLPAAGVHRTAGVGMPAISTAVSSGCAPRATLPPPGPLGAAGVGAALSSPPPLLLPPPPPPPPAVLAPPAPLAPPPPPPPRSSITGLSDEMKLDGASMVVRRRRRPFITAAGLMFSMGARTPLDDSDGSTSVAADVDAGGGSCGATGGAAGAAAGVAALPLLLLPRMDMGLPVTRLRRRMEDDDSDADGAIAAGGDGSSAGEASGEVAAAASGGGDTMAPSEAVAVADTSSPVAGTGAPTRTAVPNLRVSVPPRRMAAADAPAAASAVAAAGAAAAGAGAVGAAGAAGAAGARGGSVTVTPFSVMVSPSAAPSQ